MHLGVVVALISEHIQHLTPDNLIRLVGPLCYLHHSFLSGLSTFQFLLRDENVAGECVVLRYKERHVVVNLQCSHESILCALYYLYHLRLAYMLLSPCHERHPYSVAGKCRH